MAAGVSIDGIDISTLGMFIVRGGDEDLIVLPEQKEPEYVDWPEYAGKEYDLSNPVFEERDVTVQYYLMGNEKTFKYRLNEFRRWHWVTGYRELYIQEFDRTFNLRFKGISDYSQNRGFSVNGDKNAHIDVDYVMDDPVQFLDNAITTPNGSGQQTYVGINDYDLSSFGINVREVYNSALCFSVKEPLIFESDYKTGVTADVDATLAKDDAEINIKCTMTADSLEQFWHNYNALWYHLSAGEIKLSLTAARRYWKCWYKKMSAFTKVTPFGNRIMVRFTLTLVAFMPVHYLLFTEAGKAINTENGNVIDMNTNGYD